jgi:hypothetical protein
MLVDLERRLVAHLLPDREPATLAAWLTDHPSIECISRDRAGGYAEGARQGAPRAIQVADRFHVLTNLTDAIHRALELHHRTIHPVVPAPEHRDAVSSAFPSECRPHVGHRCWTIMPSTSASAGGTAVTMRHGSGARYGKSEGTEARSLLSASGSRSRCAAQRL